MSILSNVVVNGDNLWQVIDHLISGDVGGNALGWGPIDGYGKN